MTADEQKFILKSGQQKEDKMAKKEFTASEVMVLQEQILHQVKIVAEQHGTIVENIDQIKDDVSVLKSDVSVIKADVSVLKADVSVLKSDVSVLKDDMQIVKSSLRRKVDIEDFQILEKRVLRLEKKMA